MTMWIRLTRKLADCLDGIDVSCRNTGDVFELQRGDAELLIAEQWALPCRAPNGRLDPDLQDGRVVEKLRRPRQRLAQLSFDREEGASVEDRAAAELGRAYRFAASIH